MHLPDAQVCETLLYSKMSLYVCAQCQVNMDFDQTWGYVPTAAPPLSPVCV